MSDQKVSRTASALKALTYAVPHLAGAIDIVMVRQPDGNLKSSPFYVRFGKYTGLRSQDKRVRIAINDSELDFTMHLGRTGEVYFVTEVIEEVEGDLEAAEAVAMSEAALDGMTSPPMGYSDDETEDSGLGLPPTTLGLHRSGGSGGGGGGSSGGAVEAAAEVLRGAYGNGDQQGARGNGEGGSASPGSPAQLAGGPSQDSYWTPRNSVDFGGASLAGLSLEPSGVTAPATDGDTSLEPGSAALRGDGRGTAGGGGSSSSRNLSFGNLSFVSATSDERAGRLSSEASGLGEGGSWASRGPSLSEEGPGAAAGFDRRAQHEAGQGQQAQQGGFSWPARGATASPEPLGTALGGSRPTAAAALLLSPVATAEGGASEPAQQPQRQRSGSGPPPLSAFDAPPQQQQQQQETRERQADRDDHHMPGAPSAALPPPQSPLPLAVGAAGEGGADPAGTTATAMPAEDAAAAPNGGAAGSHHPPDLQPLHLSHMHILANGATAIPAQPASCDPARSAAAEVESEKERSAFEEAHGPHHVPPGKPPQQQQAQQGEQEQQGKQPQQPQRENGREQQAEEAQQQHGKQEQEQEQQQQQVQGQGEQGGAGPVELHPRRGQQGQQQEQLGGASQALAGESPAGQPLQLGGAPSLTLWVEGEHAWHAQQAEQVERQADATQREPGVESAAGQAQQAESSGSDTRFNQQAGEAAGAAGAPPVVSRASAEPTRPPSLGLDDTGSSNSNGCGSSAKTGDSSPSAAVHAAPGSSEPLPAAPPAGGVAPPPRLQQPELQQERGWEGSEGEGGFKRPHQQQDEPEGTLALDPQQPALLAQHAKQQGFPAAVDLESLHQGGAPPHPPFQQQAEQAQQHQHAQQRFQRSASQGSAGSAAPSALTAALSREGSGREGGASRAQHAGRAEQAQQEGAYGGVQLSLCWHLLRPGMTAQEVFELFMRHRVTPEQYTAEASTLLASPQLACRLGPTVCRWADALPLVVGLAAFGPAVAGALQHDHSVEDYPILPSGDLLGTSPLSPASSFGAGGLAERSGSSSSWRGWLFGSWRGSRKEGQQAQQEGVGAEGDGEGRPLGEGEAQGGGGGSREEGGPAGAAEAAAATAAAGGEGAAVVAERDAGAEEEVPLQKEAELLADAVEGHPTAAVSEEVTGLGPVTASGKRLVRLKRRTFVPAPGQLATLEGGMREGQNTITFTFGKQQLRAYVYLLEWSTRLVVSDIDGTITKSDVLGHLGHLLGYDWTQAGITRLFSGIRRNGYDLLFLSSRSIGQASITRDYLHSLEQNGTGMPHGPVIISPQGLVPSLYREVILRRPHEFKIRCLEDIRSLFPPEWNPFYAGFGNRDTDELSYLAVGVPPSRVFLINSKGELRKASSIVRTSTWSTLGSLGELVHHMFPALPVLRRSSAWGAGGDGWQHAERAQQQGAGGEPGAGSKPGQQQEEDGAGGGGRSSSESARPPPTEPQPMGEREEYNDYLYWRVAPPIVIGSEDEEFGDPEAQGGYDSSHDRKDDEDDDGLDGMRICG